jgi:hypothetical protein
LVSHINISLHHSAACPVIANLQKLHKMYAAFLLIELSLRLRREASSKLN